MAQKPAQTDREGELSTAIAAALDSPNDAAAWDRVDEALDRQQQPELVAPIYAEVIKPGASRELIAEIGQRGLRFFETWFGESSAELPAFLEHVLTVDPRANWAFERLTVAYTVGARFSDLLRAYDAAIASAD